jgi:signal transduction histidine kinase
MIAPLRSWSKQRWIRVASTGAVISVIALAWLGHRATTEWQRSAELAAQRNTDAAADLLFTAVTRDMRGVQASVLSTLEPDDGTLHAALDVDAIASAFARYPYPDVFFAATLGDGPGPVTFYSRTDRPPAYLPGASPDTPFPVFTMTQPVVGDRLLRRIIQDFHKRKTLSAFNQSIDGVPCQVVALLSYSDHAKSGYHEVVGFIVNLDWARRRYFEELALQVGRIRGEDSGLRLTVLDAGGAVRAGVAPSSHGGPTSTRRFPLLFFDPALTDLDPPPDLATEWWVGRASIADNREILAARTGVRVTLLVASISAIVLAGGLALGASAAFERARLTDMRADFIAAVTHDLKTPTATIRAIGESCVRRSSVDDSTRREYGEIVLHETKRLTRLIDNLLAYARISDVADVYVFRPTAVGPLIADSLNEFDFRLKTGGFAVSVDIPSELPLISADAAALSLAIGNLFDNAIRYSDRRREIGVRAFATESAVMLDVTDSGIGIALEEIGKVTHKFFRGSGTISGGSGLGLAIAERIVTGHSGTLSIDSTLDVGTRVRLTFPTAGAS